LLPAARLAASLFWLLAKSPLGLWARLLLLNRRLTTRLTLSLLLTKSPLKLNGRLLLLNRRLNSRLTLFLLLTKNPPLRLRTWLLRQCAWLLLLNRRLAPLLTSTTLLALLLCIGHLAIAIDEASAGSLAGLRIVGRLSLGRRLRQYDQGQQRCRRLEHLRVLQLETNLQTAETAPPA
jgi:hypothetical protein